MQPSHSLLTAMARATSSLVLASIARPFTCVRYLRAYVIEGDTATVIGPVPLRAAGGGRQSSRPLYRTGRARLRAAPRRVLPAHRPGRLAGQDRVGAGRRRAQSR